MSAGDQFYNLPWMPENRVGWGQRSQGVPLYVGCGKLPIGKTMDINSAGARAPLCAPFHYI